MSVILAWTFGILLFFAVAALAIQWETIKYLRKYRDVVDEAYDAQDVYIQSLRRENAAIYALVEAQDRMIAHREADSE